MDINKKIREYILTTPDHVLDSRKKRSAFYKATAQKFGVSWEKVVGIYITTKGKPTNQSQPKAPATNSTHTLTNNNTTSTPVSYEFRQDLTNGTAQMQDVVNSRMTLEEAILHFEIDEEEWEVVKYECKRWDFSIKNNDGHVVTKPQYSAYLVVRQRKIDSDLGLQKQIILDEIKKFTPASQTFTVSHPANIDGDTLLEISIPDLHIGKLAWGKETGEDYDTSIAIARYNQAVDELLSRIPASGIDRILLPIGNDMINIDNKMSTTTSGTPQGADSRFGKMFRTAKNLVIDTIGRLSAIAPVDVVVVAGNHDNLTMFTLGEVVEAFYHDNPLVRVNNSPKQRKYYQYGQNGLMFTHGNEEKHLELGLIFATEEPELWAATRFREVHLGHLHKRKSTNWVSVDENQGFKVRILSSLSGTDAWHYSKGYNSMKAAQAFLYHKEKGLLAEYNYNV